MQIALFPCVRVMAHYAHVGSITKKTDVCSAFMHAPCARIARNEEQRSPSCFKSIAKRIADPRRARLLSIVDHPHRFMSMDISNLDFSHAPAFDGAIRPGPLLYVTLDHFVKNVIMKFALACM